MVDVAREIAEIRETMRRAQRRARVDQLRARAIAAGRKVPPRRARRRFSVARINAVLGRATRIRDAARRFETGVEEAGDERAAEVVRGLRRDPGLRGPPPESTHEGPRGYAPDGEAPDVIHRHEERAGVVASHL